MVKYDKVRKCKDNIGLHRVNVCDKWLRKDVSNLMAMHTNNLC